MRSEILRPATLYFLILINKIVTLLTKKITQIDYIFHIPLDNQSVDKN